MLAQKHNITAAPNMIVVQKTNKTEVKIGFGELMAMINQVEKEENDIMQKRIDEDNARREAHRRYIEDQKKKREERDERIRQDQVRQ